MEMPLKTFRTDDLNVAGFLQEQGFNLINCDRKNGRVTFIFRDDDENGQSAVMLYLNGGTVAAVKYADRLRHLKTLVMRGLSAERV